MAQKVVFDDVTIAEHEESVVDIDGRDLTSITGMASNRADGNIVIAGGGDICDEYSHITVINRKGEIQRQDQIKREQDFWVEGSYRFCCFLSEYKVATTYQPHEIGIYDVRDGSYKRK